MLNFILHYKGGKKGHLISKLHKLCLSYVYAHSYNKMQHPCKSDKGDKYLMT